MTRALADCGHDDHYALPNSECCISCDAPPGWMKRAACGDYDNEVFFGGAVATRVARSICARCPMRPYCLELGWEEQYGVWAGLTENQREKLRRALGLDRVAGPERRRTIRTIAARELNP